MSKLVVGTMTRCVIWINITSSRCRDQTQATVENTQQRFEFLGPIGVSRSVKKLSFGFKDPFDVPPLLGQKLRENSLCSFLMLTIFGLGVLRTKCLDEKHQSHTFDSTDFVQSLRRPIPRLHRIREKSKLDRNDFCIFTQRIYSLGQERNILLCPLGLI